jgi:hypothetical protein
LHGLAQEIHIKRTSIIITIVVSILIIALIVILLICMLLDSACRRGAGIGNESVQTYTLVRFWIAF